LKCRLQVAEYSFSDMARIFEQAAADMPAIDEAILEMLGSRIEERARSYLGVPQSAGHGGFAPWAPLSPVTLANKGQEAPGTPLLETGALGASIEHERISPITVAVGTSLVSERGEPYPKYLEEGTADMPPRPFLHPAAVEVVEESLEDIGAVIVAGIGGRRTL
jgi:hypothetical protein